MSGGEYDESDARWLSTTKKNLDHLAPDQILLLWELTAAPLDARLLPSAALMSSSACLCIRAVIVLLKFHSKFSRAVLIVSFQEFLGYHALRKHRIGGHRPQSTFETPPIPSIVFLYPRAWATVTFSIMTCAVPDSQTPPVRSLSPCLSWNPREDIPKGRN